MGGTKWTFVKRTFNTLGIAKAAVPSSSLSSSRSVVDGGTNHTTTTTNNNSSNNPHGSSHQHRNGRSKSADRASASASAGDYPSGMTGITNERVVRSKKKTAPNNTGTAASATASASATAGRKKEVSSSLFKARKKGATAAKLLGAAGTKKKAATRHGDPKQKKRSKSHKSSSGVPAVGADESRTKSRHSASHKDPVKKKPSQPQPPPQHPPEHVFICKALGMEEDTGMCFKHPNQPIMPSLMSPTSILTTDLLLEEVHLCKICDSESLMPFQNRHSKQRKSMASVIGQVKELQSNKADWRRRTAAMFWNIKQALDFEQQRDSDNDDDDDERTLLEEEALLALSVEEWESQVTARIYQVRNWDEEHQLQGHVIFSRYFKMLGMGIPPEAVQNACDMDGYPPEVLGLDPCKSLKSQLDLLDETIQAKLQELAVVDNHKDADEDDDDDEEDMEPDEIMNKVRTAFQRLKSRELLKAVRIVHKLEAKNHAAAAAEAENQDPSLKKKKKKKKMKEHDDAPTTPRRRGRKPKSSSQKGENDDDDEEEEEEEDDASLVAAELEALHMALQERDMEIAQLRQELSQKDVLIQNLMSSLTSLSSSQGVMLRRQTEDASTAENNSHSEHAVIVPMTASEDEDDAYDDDVEKEEDGDDDNDQQSITDSRTGQVDCHGDEGDDVDDDEEEENSIKAENKKGQDIHLVENDDGDTKALQESSATLEIQLQGYDFVTGESKETSLMPTTPKIVHDDVPGPIVVDAKDQPSIDHHSHNEEEEDLDHDNNLDNGMGDEAVHSMPENKEVVDQSSNWDEANDDGHDGKHGSNDAAEESMEVDVGDSSHEREEAPVENWIGEDDTAHDIGHDVNISKADQTDETVPVERTDPTVIDDVETAEMMIEIREKQATEHDIADRVEFDSNDGTAEQNEEFQDNEDTRLGTNGDEKTENEEPFDRKGVSDVAENDVSSSGRDNNGQAEDQNDVEQMDLDHDRDENVSGTDVVECDPDGAKATDQSDTDEGTMAPEHQANACANMPKDDGVREGGDDQLNPVSPSESITLTQSEVQVVDEYNTAMSTPGEDNGNYLNDPWENKGEDLRSSLESFDVIPNNQSDHSQTSSDYSGASDDTNKEQGGNGSAVEPKSSKDVDLAALKRRRDLRRSNRERQC